MPTACPSLTYSRLSICMRVRTCPRYAAILVFEHCIRDVIQYHKYESTVGKNGMHY